MVKEAKFQPTVTRLLTLPFILLVIFSFLPKNSFGRDNIGRMGIGTTNQLANDMPAISFKIMKDASFGIGGVIAFSTSEDEGGHGAGIKVYKLIFDEPQLQFYASGLAAMIKEKGGQDEGSGFQLDATLGSEFSFQGLDSLGFSFEVGFSMNKTDEMVIETVGYHFIVAALHFYL